MKLTENTKVKIRVPKHLYEAIQAELDKKHMEEGDYGHDETVEEGNYSHDETMEENQDLKEIMTGAEFEANKIASIFKIDPFLGSVILVGGLFLGIISLPKAIQLAKAGAAVTGDKAAKVLSNIKNMFLKTRSGKENKPEVDKLEPSAAGADQQTEEYQLEEVLDLQTLMEAVKDASKKKEEEKKKKEAEAKKKKEAEDKKKADEKKKKEAEAKKKAEAAKKK